MAGSREGTPHTANVAPRPQQKRFTALKLVNFILQIPAALKFP